MFCPRCGNNNDNNARFCFSCGQRFQAGSQPAGPSGPDWGRFQDPAPAPPPTPQPMAPPPPQPRPVVHTQIAAPPPKPAKRTNPALAVAIIAGLAIVIGAVFFVTKDDNKSSGGGPFGGGDELGLQEMPATRAPGTAPTRAPAVPDGPIVAPGYKMTAIFVPPTGSNDTNRLDKRLYDAIVAGVDWNDSAKLYGRRYPLQYVFQNATTNLLLKPPDREAAQRLLAAAGFNANSKPKFLLTFNPTDNVFATWLTQQINALGYNVVTDANSFTADEKSRGYHGMIIAILPNA